MAAAASRPAVHVTPGLNRGQKPSLAMYTWGGGGLTAGIHLDQDWVYKEHASGKPDNKSIRQVLVHELQHAITADRTGELWRAAKASGAPYSDGLAYSEGRADTAKVLYAELDQRAGADGTPLNRLDPTQRREAVREIVSQHLTPIDRSDRFGAEIADQRLYEAVREDGYIGQARGGHQVWAEVSDARTDAYILGTDRYDQVHLFIPSHQENGTARYREVSTPLDELAERWTTRRRELQAKRAQDAAGAPERDGGPGAAQVSDRNGEPAGTGNLAKNTVAEREQTTGMEERGGSAAAILRARNQARQRKGTTPGSAPATGKRNLITRVRTPRKNAGEGGGPEATHKERRTDEDGPSQETRRPPTRYADRGEEGPARPVHVGGGQREPERKAGRGKATRAGARTVAIGGETPMPATAPAPATGSSVARSGQTRGRANETTTR